MSRFRELTPALVAMATATLLVLSQATAGAAAAPAASVAADYDISLKDLRQVKRPPPPKKKANESRKKKKGAGKAHKPSDSELSPTEGEGAHQAPTKNVAAPRQLSQGIMIIHEPYSYLVAGKRTVVRAVISGEEDIKSVYCSFRAVEGGTGAAVAMVKETGSQFTYAATLPALAADSRFLRYNIVVVDAKGKETRSPEFVINVKPSPVVPGWQLEDSGDKIGIELENKEKPLQGFSDKGLSQ